MNKSNSGNNMLLPVLLAVFGGGLPLFFGGDVRLFLLVILIFFGLGTFLLLVKLDVAREAVLLILGGSLIINPNKYFMVTGLEMNFFGGQVVPFLSLTDLAMVVLLWSVLSQKSSGPAYRLPKTAMVPLFLWVLSMAASLVGAAYPDIGFWHMTFEWKCILLYFTVLWLSRGRTPEQIKRDVRIIFYGLAAGILAETLAVVAEYFGFVSAGFSFLGIQIGGFLESLGPYTLNRVGGTYRHPNYLAIPMAALLVPMVAITLRSRGVMQRFLFGGAAACATLTLLLALSRGGWLAGIVSSAIFLALLVTTKRGIEFLKRNSRLLLILCVIAIVALGFLSGTIRNKLLSSGANLAGRVVLNKMALEMIQDHPLTGVGLNNSSDASADYNMMLQFTVYVGVLPVIHNIYLLIGAEVGVIGLLAFVTFVLYLLIRGLALAHKRMDNDEAAFLLGALVAGAFAYLTADMFGPGLRKPEISYLFWCHLGLVTLLVNTINATTEKQ